MVPYKKIFLIFVLWRIAIFVFSVLSVSFLPLAGKNFFGGGLNNYLTNSYFWGLANFDGEHYLAIATFGYQSLKQAFFPVYPLLIGFLAQIFNNSLAFKALAGILVSNLSFLLALIFLWKLIRIDYSQKTAFLTLLILLVFPTSFYFGAVYTESLFLLLTVLSFYFAKKGNWFLSGIFGGISSAVRVFGVLLLPAFLIYIWQKRIPLKKSFWIFLVPGGLLIYMFYLNQSVGDPVAFYNLQTNVGPQHQKGIILFPQVVFRYLKMFFSVSYQNPLFQTLVLELITGLLFFILPIYGFLKKQPLSYIFYGFFGFLGPTIQGSFSSSPRYVLVLFPSFIFLSLFLEKMPKLVKISYLIVSFVLLAVETMLFFRGFWVA